MATSLKPRPPRRPKTAADRHPTAIAFGECLKQARIAADKSQQELAFDASIDRTYVSLLERGLASPSLLVIVDLAASIGLSLTHLIAEFEAHLASQRVRKTRTKRRVNQATLDGKNSRPQATRRSPLR